MSDGINDSIPGRGMRKVPMTEASGKPHPQQEKHLWCNTCHYKGDRVGTSSWTCTITNPSIMLCCGPDDIILKRVGCASHSSSPQPAAGKADPTRYMSEEQRKYILSFKEEDPLLMAYVEGQKAAEQRIKDVIAELEQRKNDQSGWATEAHYQGASTAYKRTISLLRGN